MIRMLAEILELKVFLILLVALTTRASNEILVPHFTSVKNGSRAKGTSIFTVVPP